MSARRSWRCCRWTRTPAPRHCARLHDRLGVTVAVVVTDTMGRAWRNGQTDCAIGAAGLTVLHGYAGSHDRHGNELIVTEVAVADEIAAAADLVKGKLTGVPVAVVRGLTLRDNGSNAHAAAAGRGRPVLVGHRRSASAGPQPGPAAAPVGPSVQCRTRCARTHRGRGRRSAHRAGLTTPGRCDSSGCRTATPASGCWTG